MCSKEKEKEREKETEKQRGRERERETEKQRGKERKIEMHSYICRVRDKRYKSWRNIEKSIKKPIRYQKIKRKRDQFHKISILLPSREIYIFSGMKPPPVPLYWLLSN